MHYRGKNYKRIMLLGNSGSGKSWTAERLGKKTGYPVTRRRRCGMRKTGNL